MVAGSGDVGVLVEEDGAFDGEFRVMVAWSRNNLIVVMAALSKKRVPPPDDS